MTQNILVTGGAGFIGSHLVDALVERGHRVRVLDSLDPQVHGENATPRNIESHIAAGRVEFIKGDVRDRPVVDRALDGIEVVFHEAAAVGVGQSMYRIVDYVSVNTLGGAVVLEAVIARRPQIRKMVVASSMSIYGEGSYVCPEHGPVVVNLRPAAQFEAADWEIHCPACGATAQPQPTDENKPLVPTSIYATTKRDHEEMFLTVGAAYGIPTVALRYFNVYGPRQSLNNPYTGVAAIFASRLLNGNPPLVFEDGEQSRDFIHVSDIVKANLLALEKDEANGEVFNVGTGRRLRLVDMVDALREKLGGPEAEFVGRYRQGDIRHCYASISKIASRLGFAPGVRFEDGVRDLTAWAEKQEAVDQVDRAKKELETAGLTV